MEASTLILAGRYRLETRIARGGAGEVWRARDTALGRPVAVKLLHPGYTEHPHTLARFRAEARHAAGLAHPGIAQVYDYGEDGQPFLVLELVDGPSLAAVVARGPLDAARVLDVIAQTAAALAAAHAAGLVHRDIKPANLLLGPGGQLKVTDFGIAHAAGSASLTRAGTVVGTPAYLAPERITGRPATAASDLYSLGIVGYECLTGVPPFTGTPVEIAMAHCHGRVPPLSPPHPAEVAALVGALTAKDPAARPAGAAEVARWAARLRDTRARTGPGPREYPAAAALAGPAPAARLDGPGRTRPDNRTAILASPGGPPAPGRPAGRRGPGRPAAALGLAFALLTAGLAWLLSAGSGPGGPARAQGTPRVAATVSTSAPRPAEVSAAALVGRPVRAVAQRLRRLGLRVQITWAREGPQPTGTVVAVQPAGALRPGSTVVVTGALAHPHHGHDHGPGPGPGHSGP